MNNSSVSTSWLIIPKPIPDARTRLFVFPYAGGSPAAFWKWPVYLPDSVEVMLFQFPGKGKRLGESPIVELPVLIHEIVNEMSLYFDKKFIFFGHSLGALFAFETIRALRKREILPLHFFVSSGLAPNLPNPRKKIHLLPDEEFIKEIRDLNGLPQELFQYPDLVEILLNSLRADFSMLCDYEYSPELSLECPISVYGGVDDPLVDNKHLSAWQNLTTASFSLKLFKGGHFYFNEDERLFFDTLGHDLDAIQSYKKNDQMQIDS